jgi:pyruvate formate lyase activating enzyme
VKKDAEELTGLVFDIKEFALFDGPGLRCTVFLKGCPLRCSWCHNPEGIKPTPEYMKSASGKRLAGRYYSVSELAGKLFSYEGILKDAGGVSFSGGEPLFQADFLIETMRRLKGRLHILLQTSGCAEAQDFAAVTDLADTVYFDLKVMNPALHRRFTGVDNAGILDNLKRLDRSGPVYRLRVPMIPGVTDTIENYDDIRSFIKNNLNTGGYLDGLDLLPYNPAAGGKYEAVGRKFEPEFDEQAKTRVNPDFFLSVVKEAKSL